MDFTKQFYKKYGKNDDQLQIISVHSAKGGVGKTLFSLLMGNQIRMTPDEEGLHPLVFVMDLDFCGTALSDLLENKKKKQKDDGQINPSYIHHIPVSRLDEGITFKKEDFDDWDMLNLFNTYLKGKDIGDLLIPQKLQQGRNRNKQWEDRLIIIPSGKFYEKSAPDKKPEEAGKNSNFLFDTIHAQWFCEFIFQTIFQIYHNVNKTNNKKVYFILDNGPGWSELVPLLHTYLIKWGIHRAKFLQIASTDKMDIDSTLENLDRLYQEYFKIYITKKIYYDDLCRDKNAQIDNMIIDGYLDHLRELNSHDRTLKLLQTHNTNSPVSQFTALILNKVQPDIDIKKLEDHIREKFEKLLNPYAEYLQFLNKNKIQNFQISSFFASIPVLQSPYDSNLALAFQDIFIKQANITPQTTSRHFNDVFRDETFVELKPLPEQVENVDTFELKKYKDDSDLFEKLYVLKEKDNKSYYQLNKEELNGNFVNYHTRLKKAGYSAFVYIDMKAIISLDYQIYRYFVSSQSSFLCNKLINIGNFHVFSHMLRVIAFFFNLFRYCAHFVLPLYKHAFAELNMPLPDHEHKLKYDIINHRFTDAGSAVDWEAAIPAFFHEITLIKKRTDSKQRAEMINIIKRITDNNKNDIQLNPILKQIFIFYFSLFAALIIYLSKPEPKPEKTSLDFGKKEPEYDLFIPVITELFNCCISLINNAQKNDNEMTITQASAEFISEIEKLYKAKKMDLASQIGIELKSIYHELSSVIKSFEMLEQKYELIDWIRKGFEDYFPMQTMGFLYLSSAMEALFNGYSTKIEQIKAIIEMLYMDKDIHPKYKRLGNIVSMEDKINAILKEWNKKK